MEQASITVKVDADFMTECDDLFAQMGITTDAAISIFLPQAVACQDFPFGSPIAKYLSEQTQSRIPEVGYRNESGLYVLPSDMDDPEDEIYDELV